MITLATAPTHPTVLAQHEPVEQGRRRIEQLVRSGFGCVRLALALTALPLAAHADARSELSGLVGRSKAELIQRLGFPSNSVTTVDGERLTYDTLDAGRVGGRSGRDARAGEFGAIGPFPRRYSFRCTTEVVIRDGRVRAFNRSGNDCR